MNNIKSVCSGPFARNCYGFWED